MTLLKYCLLLICISFSAGQTLRSLAGNRYVGTSVHPNTLTSDAEFTKVADREFSCFTPENEMKWDATESSRGQYNFREGDALVAHAQAHGQKVRGHTLVWHSQQPGWFANGHFSSAEMTTIMKNHIQAVAGHFKGKLYAWDVVNEAFEGDGSLRKSNLFNTMGENFIAEAFRAAHEADPTAKLYYNDYGAENINAKSTGILNFVKKLKSQGVPIHGVGFQGHFSVGHIPGDLQANLARFAALDLDVALTEVDIALNLPANQQQLEQQGKDYAAVWKACLGVSRCVGVTAWGLTDKYSWIPGFSPGHGAALMFDEHYQEKPAYKEVQKVLQGH